MKSPQWLIASAIALVPHVSGLASTDSPSDADPAQSGYLPNHNMDPAVVDSAGFGQLWKAQFNAKEQVGEWLSLLEGFHLDASISVSDHRVLVLCEAPGLYANGQ